jgi:ribonuclease J
MMAHKDDEFVFVALGGLGEIGMNAALYGFGPPSKRQWILVDCGVSFAGDDVPGIDLVMPDLRFIEDEGRNLLAIIITHAHEDHIGALADLWPRLKVPVYLSKFAAGLLATRRLSESDAPKIPMKIIGPQDRINLGPFDIEFLSVAHSIPEAMGLAIRTPLGMAVHSGDWKIDATPVLPHLTDPDQFRALGDEGVLALVSDSTNATREGVSPSEQDVCQTLEEIIRKAPARVAVTTFASNVARIKAVADAARACGREVVIVGRAMDRAIKVAQDCGYIDMDAPFQGQSAFGYLPRDKVVLILTGSQGEPRAALARIAADDHPDIALSAGDTVIFSSRTIPGNEKPVGKIINGLIDAGIDVVTDRDALVHVSGHPRKGEMAQMYEWLRPQIAVPVHGEPLHLSRHAIFAREQGVQNVLSPRDGTMVRFAPGKAEVIDQIPTGRLYKDGSVIISSGERTVSERKKLATAGIVSVALCLDSKGQIAGEAQIEIMGLPPLTKAGDSMVEYVSTIVDETLDTLPKARRRDATSVEEAVKKAIRARVNEAWGKKPACHVLVVEI